MFKKFVSFTIVRFRELCLLLNSISDFLYVKEKGNAYSKPEIYPYCDWHSRHYNVRSVGIYI